MLNCLREEGKLNTEVVFMLQSYIPVPKTITLNFDALIHHENT